MQYLLWIFMIVIGIVFPKNRLITLFQSLYIIIIIGCNTASPDFSNYEFMYNNINSGIFRVYEPGYVLLNKLCMSVNMSFTGFRCIVATIMVCIIVYALINRVKRLNYILSVFIVYPVLIFASGIRYAIPFAIVIYATCIYIDENTKHALVKFIICLIISILFHYSFIFFVPILLIKREFTSTQVIKVVIAEIALFIMGFSGVLLSIVARFTQHQKILTWLNFRSANSPSIIVDFCFIALFILIFFCLRRQMRADYHYEDTEYNYLYIENTTWLLLIYLPFLFINVTFERLEEIVFAICACLLADQFNYRDIRRLVIPMLGFLCNLAFCFVIHGNIFFPILSNNSIL